MNLVDSSGWIEYFADGPNAAFFAAAVEGVEKLVVPSICTLEVFRWMLREQDEPSALEAVAAMRQGRLVDLDLDLSLAAAKLKLPLADSIVLATARAHAATLWTQDADFEGMDGVRFVAKRGAKA